MLIPFLKGTFMTDTPYEAIGRCKVLREQINTLEAEHFRHIEALTALLDGSKRLASNVVYEMDTERAHQLLAKADEAKADEAKTAALEAVREFNRWALQAGEAPIKAKRPG
jgi:CHASE3 domain sensor protein